MGDNGKQQSAMCPMCNGSAVKHVRTLSSTHALVECRLCATRFADPFGAPRGSFYDTASDLASEYRHSGATPWYPDHPSRSSPLFTKGSQGRLLDVGCGNGAFAEFAAAAGYEV